MVYQRPFNAAPRALGYIRLKTLHLPPQALQFSSLLRAGDPTERPQTAERWTSLTASHLKLCAQNLSRWMGDCSAETEKESPLERALVPAAHGAASAAEGAAARAEQQRV